MKSVIKGVAFLLGLLLLTSALPLLTLLFVAIVYMAYICSFFGDITYEMDVRNKNAVTI